MDYLIQKFLSENQLAGTLGIDYSLIDRGNGVEIENWNFNIPKPVFTEKELKSTQKKESLKKLLIAARLKFLQDTDFKVLRFIDEGTPYPNEIKTKRIQARKEINEIEACTTLTQLQQFSEVIE